MSLHPSSGAGSTPASTDPVRTPPALSVVVLTLNEADNIEDAVRSLLDQEVPLEILVVDGDSPDGTADIVRRLEAVHPETVRLIASRPLPIGPARNLGLDAARAPLVAFMSADATAAPGWASAMVAGLDAADIVYGRQEHAPAAMNVPALVRGLRYHHFQDDTARPPETYASNVNAAIRRPVFERLRYVDEGPASALDDLLFTHEAKSLGLTIGYAPGALVRHKDASTLGGELAKNRREGYGWGILAPTLGYHHAILAWALLLMAGIAFVAFRPGWWSLAVLAGLVWAPAVRRIVRAGGRFVRTAPRAFVGAILVSPFFDLAFLFDYLRGLRRRRPDLTGRIRPQGA